MKPSFEPYCVMGDVMCSIICECRVSNSCTILPMDNEIRSKILFSLNQVRNSQGNRKHQPSGLSILQYDLNLEELSMCWAAFCDNGVTDCLRTPNFPDSSQTSGQRSMKGKYPTIDLWHDLIIFWSKGIDSFNTSALIKIPSNDVGFKFHNLAQILSDKVLFVGCAWSTSNDIITFICTYAPRGPLDGEEIYKVGRKCSRCPKGYACNYEKPFSNLCKLNLAHESNATLSKYKRMNLTDARSARNKVKKTKIISVVLTIIIVGIVFCIFLSLVFLVAYYIMYW